MSFISAFRTDWKSIAFPRFKDVNFIVFQQAAWADSVFVLVNGMTEGKRKMVTGHGLIQALLVLGGGLRFLGGRRFRPFPFPLALLLLVLFLLSLQGIAGEVSADQITGSKAEQQAGCDRLDSREASVEPALKGDGGDDAENGRKKMGKVFHSWQETIYMGTGIILGFICFVLALIINNNGETIKYQEELIELKKKNIYYWKMEASRYEIFCKRHACEAERLANVVMEIESVVEGLQKDQSEQKIQETLACIRCLKNVGLGRNDNETSKDVSEN